MLVIDDSPTIVALLKRMLVQNQLDVLEAFDAESGIEIARREVPDLVFLDIVLPGMDGFNALRALRRDPATKDVPIIMISGNAQATEQFYVQRIGADDFMKKPFSRHEVFARIESLVEEKRLKQLLAPEEKPIVKPAPAPQVQAQVQAKPKASAAPQKSRPQPATAKPAKAAEPSITALEARKHLTAMGLQYFSQEQFVAAIERGDTLAVELFIAGGSVNVNA